MGSPRSRGGEAVAARKPTSKTVSFGAEVTRLREEAGLNRTELAARAAVTRSYISQVESGRTKCRKDFAERLDKALDSGTALVDAWDEVLRSSSYPKFFAEFPEPRRPLTRCARSRPGLSTGSSRPSRTRE
ncbi:multiprotein-bridging factor 1 family protein [Spirillospora sp. NPDC048824]|uniref:helix-turn-helix domain-containing protein n=1 Tax=Spirillospora sp. NPDC048824 TaxID=3364526 RepID=UPI003717A224